MNRIEFTDEEEVISRRGPTETRSQLTKIIQKASFGLVKTKQQATLVKLGIIVMGLLWVLVYFSISQEPAIEPPSQQLINSPQPIN